MGWAGLDEDLFWGFGGATDLQPLQICVCVLILLPQPLQLSFQGLDPVNPRAGISPKP